MVKHRPLPGPLLHRVRAPEGCSVEHRRLVVREITADRSAWRRSEPAGERARVELVKHRPLSGPLLHRARARDGRSVEPPSDLIVREVAPDRSKGEGWGRVAEKWARVELNHRPHAYQACALTRLSYGPRRRPARDRSVRGTEGRAPGGLHPKDTARWVQVSWAPGIPFSTT